MSSKFNALVIALCLAANASAQTRLRQNEYRQNLDAVLERATVETQYFVDVDRGNDSDAGTYAEPFATIGAARDAVTAAKPHALPVVVYIRGGIYRQTTPLAFDPDDSGTSACPITYRSFPGESASLRAATKVSGTWATHSGSIKKITLAGQAEFLTLVVDGQLCQRARTPNAGSFYLQETNTGSNVSSIEVDTGDAAGYSANLVSGHTEAVCYVGFKALRTTVDAYAAGTLSMALDSAYAFDARTDYGRYYLENELAFLDQAGEWYWDDAAETLYYWPRAGETLGTSSSNSVVEIANNESIVTLTGVENSLPVVGEDFVVSLRFKSSYTTTGSKYMYLLSTKYSAGAWAIGLRDTATPSAQGVYFADYDLNQNYTGAAGLNDGNWHTIVTSFGKSSTGTFRTWIDGTEAGSAYNISAKTIHAGSPNIGGQSTAESNYTGSIDDIVILAGACTSGTTATAIASGDYTGFTTLLDIDFDEGFTVAASDTVEAMVYREVFDSSPDKNSAPTLTADGNGGYAATFDGTDDYLQLDGLAGRYVEHLRFEGLDFCVADRPPVEDSGGGVSNLTQSFDGHEDDVAGAVNLLWARDVEFVRCALHDVGGSAVRFTQSRRIDGWGNEIYRTGYCAAASVGVSGDVSPNLNGGHDWVGNTIHDVGKIFPEGLAALFQYAGQSHVNGNYIYNCPHTAIRDYGTFNSLYQQTGGGTIAYNHVHDAMQELHDGACVMMSGYHQGIHVHHNRLEDGQYVLQAARVGQTLSEADNYSGGRGIYLDEGTHGALVENNWVCNMEDSAIILHQTNRNTIVNNVVAKARNGIEKIFNGTKPYLDGTVADTEPIEDLIKYNVIDHTCENMIYLRFADSSLNEPTEHIAEFDYNLWGFDNAYRYATDNGAKQGAQTLSDVQTNFGISANSVVGSALLADVETGDLTVGPASVAHSLGFVGFTPPNYRHAPSVLATPEAIQERIKAIEAELQGSGVGQ